VTGATDARHGLRTNNFDALRFFAATSVIFSHSFLIAEGSEDNEWFVKLTSGQSILGLAGVFVFFTISGFLVTGSYFSTRSPLLFSLKRALRIFPGLWVNLLFVGLVIGPFISGLPLGDYLSSPMLQNFFKNNLVLEIPNSPLPGVTFSDNSAGQIVNGSLWTLRYEIMMYIMVFILGLTNLLKFRLCIFFTLFGIISIYFEKSLDPYGDLGEMAWLLGFFAAGMAMYFLRGSAFLNRKVAAMAILGLVVSTYFHIFIMAFPIFGSYLTIYLSLRYTKALAFLGRYGDLSYGLYIYGWPIEQGVRYVIGEKATWWQVFFPSLALCVPVAWLSWHGIEKWAVRFGQRRLPPPRLAEAKG
jgi:peptidoglycan/LPS O-acetylase OafA/YrhL